MRKTISHIVVTFAAGILGLMSCASSQASVSWKIGEEREVDQGYYFTLMERKAGWNIWKIETKNEIECRAIKSAIGVPDPVPLGATINFGMAVPFIGLYWSPSENRVVHFWEGPNMRNLRIETRRQGDKFWTTVGRNELLFDGDRLEVNIASWEYPEIRVGYDETHGSFNLMGLDLARVAVQRCYRSKTSVSD